MNETRPHDGQTSPLLEVSGLAVTYRTPRGPFHAVRDASLAVHPNEVLGLVGESGSGKSTIAYAVMGYLPETALLQGSVTFSGKTVTELSRSELRRLRGNRVAMVYQDPGTALNPTMRVGQQVEEVLREHLGLSPQGAHHRTAGLFERVGLPDPSGIGERYLHELSGGMQQRVMIAMALACNPDLLIMDEPTTGLDVTTEARILDLIVELKERISAAILFVSHNLGVIARIADRVAVMYAGEIVEQAPVRELFKRPLHPYTTGLLACVPQSPAGSGEIENLRSIPGTVYGAQQAHTGGCLFEARCPMAQDSCGTQPPDLYEIGDNHQSRCFYSADVDPAIWGPAKLREHVERDELSVPVLKAEDLSVTYGGDKKKYILWGPPVSGGVRAVVDVDFEVGTGRTLGVVGESGSGKSTAARAVAGLTARTGGTVLLQGEEVAPIVEERTRLQRAALRMVFQNPTASLNPRIPIGHAITRSIRKFSQTGRRESEEQAAALLTSVGLPSTYMRRMPRELSGGELQRAALAGAFAAGPSLAIADEAVSSLDVSVQAQVLNLILERQHASRTTFVFITHDLGVVRYISDAILVVYAGHVAEYGPAQAVLDFPSHPYTEALLSAAPVPDPDAPRPPVRLVGTVPTQMEAFKGCFFAGRCPRKLGDICDEAPPPARHGPSSSDHVINCHIPVEELEALQRHAPFRLSEDDPSTAHG